MLDMDDIKGTAREDASGARTGLLVMLANDEGGYRSVARRDDGHLVVLGADDEEISLTEPTENALEDLI